MKEFSLLKNILSNKRKLKQFGELINFKSHCYAGYDYCNIDGDIRTDGTNSYQNIMA